MALTVLLEGDPLAPQQARLGAALAARGHRVIVLNAPRIADQIRDEFGQACTAVRALPTWTGSLRTRQLRRLARLERVDIVHLNFLMPPLDAWLEPGMPPVVATAWGSDINEQVFPRSPRFRAGVDRILHGAAAVTSDSAPILASVRRRGAGQHGRPLELVLWSADLSRWQPAPWHEKAQELRAQWQVPAGAMVLLAPRQLQPHYRTELVVQGFAQSRWRDMGVLVLKHHGKSGEDVWSAEVMRQARALGVADRIRHAPRCSYAELPAVYAAADAAVSAPDADGVPSTFCELMALGVPIVATDLPAYEGVLAHGTRGLLFRPGDPADLAAQLDRLLDDAPGRARMIDDGLRWAREHGDWQRSVDAFERLYHHAVGQRQAPVT